MVELLDGQGLVADVALLLLVVHVYLDIGDEAGVDGGLGGVCGGGRMVIKGRACDGCRYTIGDAVAGGGGGAGGGGSRGLRVVHDARDGHSVTNGRQGKIFGELGGSRPG